MFRLIFPFVVPKNSFFSQRGKSYEQGFQLGRYKLGTVQPQKVAKGLKLWILEVEGFIIYYVAKTKSLSSCTATTQLIYITKARQCNIQQYFKAEKNVNFQMKSF